MSFKGSYFIDPFKSVHLVFNFISQTFLYRRWKRSCREGGNHIDDVSSHFIDAFVNLHDNELPILILSYYLLLC